MTSVVVGYIIWLLLLAKCFVFLRSHGLSLTFWLATAYLFHFWTIFEVMIWLYSIRSVGVEIA